MKLFKSVIKMSLKDKIKISLLALPLMSACNENSKSTALQEKVVNGAERRNDERKTEGVFVDNFAQYTFEHPDYSMTPVSIYLSDMDNDGDFDILYAKGYHLTIIENKIPQKE